MSNGATKSDFDKKRCITMEFRVSFPHVFTPQSYEGKEAEYSLVMLFDEATPLNKVPPGHPTGSIAAAYKAAAVEKWGADDLKWPKNLKKPFRKGAERSDTEGYEGTIFVTAKAKRAPGVIDARKRPLTDDDFYAGCYARAEIVAFAYDQSGNKGVSFRLLNIQKTRDGEPFGGRRAAEDVFDALESEDGDEATGANGAAGGDDFDLGV